MPNIKSAKKRVLLSKESNTKNRAVKTLLKTSMKKFDAAVAEGDRAAASEAYKNAVKKIDQAATKRVIPKNTAARRKSSMTIKFNTMA